MGQLYQEDEKVSSVILSFIGIGTQHINVLTVHTSTYILLSGHVKVFHTPGFL